MANLVCDPSSLQAAQPCLQALSVTQLLSVIALALCRINGGSIDTVCSANTLMDDAKCFLWMNDKKQLESLAALLVNWAVDNGFLASALDARESITCLASLSQSDLHAIITKLICEGISSGTLITPIV